MPVSSGSSVPGVGISPPSGMRTASVIAQAKVNLLLKVLAREADGYHQLETLFCRLALGDVVTVHAVPHGRSLDCVGPTMPPGGLGKVEDNLAWRAAAAFVDAAGWPDGFAIEITKHIPVGGGLGGGSADAGAVLRALNALAPTPLSPARLLHVSAQLGADVAGGGGGTGMGRGILSKGMEAVESEENVRPLGRRFLKRVQLTR